MNETCCNSFKDIASYTTDSGIEAAPSYQQLCKWTASLHTYDEWDSNTNSYKQVTYDYGWCQTDHENLNNINGKTGAQCMDPTSTYLISQGLSESEAAECTCTDWGDSIFRTADDPKCPHKGKC